MIFIGYCSQAKAYRFLDLETRRVTISRDAHFLELGAEIRSEGDCGSKDVEVVIGRTEEDLIPEVVPDEDEEDNEDGDESFYSGSDEQSDSAGDTDGEATGGEASGLRRSQRSTRGVLPQRLNDYAVGEVSLATYCSE
ncbi:uncharacterized protein LOC135701621 [Ochlerotatus camptorhynchus]|uniref:uncharacterized protein LOC135701621 n=1 Tax=Ochlerotatus camptorhynchus TaxID=644619 RepID=UPI0031D1819F